MRKAIFSVFFALGFLAVFAGYAFAQEDPDETARKRGITFPISELGNCSSFAECKTYCDLEANRDACVSFAKKKGFYKEEQRPNSEILQSAKVELGCDSEQTCRVICEQETNIERCQAFAQKHGLEGPRGKPGDQKVLQKAREILGCDSESSCRAVCEQETNQEKCSRFAQETGLGGGVRRVGPGGCNSEESCIRYCEANPAECGGGQGPRGGDEFEGRSQESGFDRRGEGYPTPDYSGAEQYREGGTEGPISTGETRTEETRSLGGESGGFTTQEVRGASTAVGLLKRVIDWLGL